MFLIHFYTHNQREITLQAALYLPIAIRNYILKSYKFLLIFGFQTSPTKKFGIHSYGFSFLISVIPCNWIGSKQRNHLQTNFLFFFFSLLGHLLGLKLHNEDSPFLLYNN